MSIYDGSIISIGNQSVEKQLGINCTSEQVGPLVNAAFLAYN